MEFKYTISTCELTEITPLKQVAHLDPDYLSTLNHIRSNGAVFPIIVSKNLLLLDGHKTVEALKHIAKEKNDGDMTTSLFIYQKNMTKAEAWSLHDALNKRGGGARNYNDTRRDKQDTTKIMDEMARQLCPNPNAIKELYKITTPLKQFLKAKLIAQSLSDLPFYLYEGLGQTLTEVFEPTLGFQSETDRQ